MPGAGEYLPDATEGITRVDDLLKAKIFTRSRDYRRQPCLSCRHSSYRHRRAKRGLHDLGDLVSGPRGRHWGVVARVPGPSERLNDRLQRKIGDLFDHWHLFVAHPLTPAERRTVQRITRGLPPLRTLRGIMDEMYRLLDRRCRTHTALAQSAKLWMRVRRFRRVGKTLSRSFFPNLEKALSFLDDALLPATPNTIEPGNRHRRMPKTVYCVRTPSEIHARIAIHMLRDAQGTGRFDTTHTLQHVRAG